MALEKSSKRERKRRLKLKHDLEIAGYSLTDVAGKLDISTQAVSAYIHCLTISSDRIENTINGLLGQRRAA